MSPEELEELLSGEDVNHTLDVKTLVLDVVRNMDEDEIKAIFHNKLPDLSADFVKDYLYMKRS